MLLQGTAKGGGAGPAEIQLLGPGLSALSPAHHPIPSFSAHTAHRTKNLLKKCRQLPCSSPGPEKNPQVQHSSLSLQPPTLPGGLEAAVSSTGRAGHWRRWATPRAVGV